MSFTFLRDQFVRTEEAVVPVNDRSFRFGDGVFETILVMNGKIYEFATHLERLENGLKAFKINFDTSDLKDKCEELIAKNSLQSGYLRLIISRGINGPKAIGYMPKDTEAYLIIQALEKDLPLAENKPKDIKLWVSSYQAHLATPSKVNSSLHYTLSMIEADENNCDNALILSHDNYLCETANGSLFWFKGGTLYTPSLDLPMVPGTIRKRIIELYDGKLKEGRFTIEDLKEADEVFMSNIGGLITLVSSVSPLGLKFAKHDKALKLREILEKDIISSTK